MSEGSAKQSDIDFTCLVNNVSCTRIVMSILPQARQHTRTELLQFEHGKWNLQSLMLCHLLIFHVYIVQLEYLRACYMTGCKI